MKKSTLIIIMAFLCSHYAISQVSPNAIGVRLGGGSFGNNAEISYQKGLGEKNRLELDLGLFNSKTMNGLGVFAGYHWNWNINQGLNWFAGPGASASLVSVKNDGSYLGIGVGGQIGIEYNFNEHNVPLLLSIDLRPLWDLVGDGNLGLGYGGALGIRYLF